MDEKVKDRQTGLFWVSGGFQDVPQKYSKCKLIVRWYIHEVTHPIVHW